MNSLFSSATGQLSSFNSAMPPAQWKPLHCLTLTLFAPNTSALSVSRSLSSFVTIVTASSTSLRFKVQRCSYTTMCPSVACVIRNTLTQTKNQKCQIRNLNSGPTSIHPSVFSDENKARVMKVISTTKIPSFRAQFKKILRQAGVCIPLCLVDGVPSILFTLRSNHINSHRGEIRLVSCTW